MQQQRYPTVESLEPDPSDPAGAELLRGASVHTGHAHVAGALDGN
jgi:hypothetical protein